MHATHARNFELLRTQFEGREAIYHEKGSIRVRVQNIRARPGFVVAADVEEIPTPGLPTGGFCGIGGERRPLQWRIGGGYLTEFTEWTWAAGYGGWTIHFSPAVVEAVVKAAASFPADLDGWSAQRSVGHVMREMDRNLGRTPVTKVFSEVIEPGTNQFLLAEGPPVRAQVSGGRVTCPFCDMAFKPGDARVWDGERHLSCGQRILIVGRDQEGGSTNDE